MSQSPEHGDYAKRRQMLFQSISLRSVDSQALQDEISLITLDPKQDNSKSPARKIAHTNTSNLRRQNNDFLSYFGSKKSLKWQQESLQTKEHKKKIYFKSIESAIPFYQVAKTKLMADRYCKPEKLRVAEIIQHTTVRRVKRKEAEKEKTTMPSQISVGSLQKDTSLSSLGAGSLDAEMKEKEVPELMPKKHQKSELLLIKEEDSMPTTRNATQQNMFFKAKQ